MSLAFQSEESATRFAPYAAELRSVFATRGVPFGEPADLGGLADRLTAPSAFQNEMSSMVRSVLFREQESITTQEIVSLLAYAVGGPQLNQDASQWRVPMEQIHSFVTGVLRSRWRSFPEEVPEAEAAPANPVLSDPQPNPPVETSTESSASDTPKPPAPSVDAPAVRSVFSRASLLSASAQVPEMEKEPAVVSLPEAVNEPSAPPSAVRNAPLPLRAARPRTLWIVGVCGVLVGLSAGLMLQHRPAGGAGLPAAVPAVASNTPAEPSAGIPLPPKPTAGSTADEATRGESPADQDDAYTRYSSPLTQPARNESKSPATELPDGAASEDTADPGESARPAKKPTGKVLGPGERNHRAAPAQPPILEPATARGILIASSGVMSAHLISAPAPSYPKLASFAHVQGQVVVQAVVGRDGRVTATQVLDGHRLLRGAAEHAVRHWRYRPYLVDGRPTDVSTIITVEFRLH